MKSREIKVFWTIAVSLLIVIISASTAVSETGYKHKEGLLEKYDAHSVKVDGWYYSLCPTNPDKGAEDKGLSVFNVNGRAVDYQFISNAHKVKIRIRLDKNCVDRIKITEVTE